MKITSAVATVLALAASASAAFTSCGSSSDDFTFGSVSYTPNPPKGTTPVQEAMRHLINSYANLPMPRH